MAVDVGAYERDLRDDTARAARRQACRTCALALQRSGNVLWAFGLAEAPLRRALATVVQMGAALALGAVQMLDAENPYAAAALVRQLVEVEYLVGRFGDDPEEARRWLSASPDELRTVFSPGAMRKRSAGRFRAEEYWSHCAIGGHPNPRAASLLPERVMPGDAPPFGSWEFLWVDLAQHLDRLWSLVEAATTREGLHDVAAVAMSRVEVAEALRTWHEQDRCAARIPAHSGGRVPAIRLPSGVSAQMPRRDSR